MGGWGVCFSVGYNGVESSRGYVIYRLPAATPQQHQRGKDKESNRLISQLGFSLQWSHHKNPYTQGFMPDA